MNKLFLLSTVALALVTFNANAGSGSADGTAQVEVVADFAVTHTGTALNFGSVYAKAGNTVAVTAAASPARSGDAFGPFTADAFTISGPQGAGYTLTVPSSAEMTNTNSDHLTATLTPSSSGALTMGNTATVIYVGGSVTTAANTPQGSYSGSYTVQISY